MTPIRLRGPADVLASLPFQLGYHPTRSVVLIALRGGLVELVERLDLPPLQEVDRAAAAMVAPIVRANADAAILVGYEEGSDRAGPVLEALADELGRAEIDVLDAITVRDGRWLRARCEEPCCPADGLPIPEASTTPAVADFVALGIAPYPDRASLADAVRADERVSRLVAAELRKGSAHADGSGGADESEATNGGPTLRQRRLAAWARLLEGGPHAPTDGAGASLEPSLVAELVRSLDDLQLRDGIVAWLCPGSLPLDTLGESLCRDLESTLGPVDDGADTVEAVRAGRRRLVCLEELVRAVPDEAAAPPLTILANLAWHLGDGTLARVALDRALACAPEYRLALLLERLVDLGLRLSRPETPDADARAAQRSTL